MTESTEGAAAEWVAVADLKVWAKNPRKNDGAVEKVAESIREFGFGAPIVARRENSEVIKGHTRLKAAKLLGLKRVPVRFLDLDERKAHALAIADNKLGEIADWDEDELNAQLTEMTIHDAGLAGWTAKDLGKLLGEAEFADSSQELDTTLQIVIDCASEAEQREVIEWAQSKGLKCLPDYQGVGIGKVLFETVAAMWCALGYRAFSRTAHPAEQASRKRSGNWRLTSHGFTARDRSQHRAASYAKARTTDRRAASYEWIGEPMDIRQARELLGVFD